MNIAFAVKSKIKKNNQLMKINFIGEQMNDSIITKDMKVSKTLNLYPQTLEVFISASPHFSKLKNPILRKALAGRVTIEQAAKIGNVDLNKFLYELNKSINKLQENSKVTINESSQIESKKDEKPEFLNDLSSLKIKELDVRPIINEGKDPLSAIMSFAKTINDDETFLLINSFEPIPLYTVLGKKGFNHFTENLADVYKVYFYKTHKDEFSDADKNNNVETFSINLNDYKNVIEIDVRELPPPEPMMKVFENLNQIDENTLLLVHHHREPLMLYPKLSERGFKAQSNKINDNYYKVFIVKSK